MKCDGLHKRVQAFLQLRNMERIAEIAHNKHGNDIKKHEV